jgi:hypothetical protein
MYLVLQQKLFQAAVDMVVVALAVAGDAVAAEVVATVPAAV